MRSSNGRERPLKKYWKMFSSKRLTWYETKLQARPTIIVALDLLKLAALALTSWNWEIIEDYLENSHYLYKMLRSP